MTTQTSFDSNEIARVISELSAANKDFMRRYPGESNRRQAVHTVYGGAHLFKADSARKLGEVALRSLKEYAPDAKTLADALGMNNAMPSPQSSQRSARSRPRGGREAPGEGNHIEAQLLQKIYDRITNKLQRQPVEDFRLDFEDGYGNRPDEEEDRHANSSALEVARGMRDGTLSPFIGIRIKPLNEDLYARSVRTLDIFITALARDTSGKLPDNFVITVPKIQLPEQVRACVRLFEILEKKTGLPAGSVKIELMIETPQSIINERGELALHSLVDAANGRCGSVHFGVYDYTASSGITAAYQTMRHPACDFARQMMLVSLAGTGIHLSDGATNILPVGPHRDTLAAGRVRPIGGQDRQLTAEQERENRNAVYQAWRLGFEDNLHSLRTGYYQGWDLHPAQFVTRYAAVYLFFLEGLASAANRLKAFVEKAALASLFGDVFDDAATGQGLLNFFLRGLACGAITDKEALATGLTLEELRSRSFQKILQNRKRT